jgi:hypothetical protein
MKMGAFERAKVWIRSKTAYAIERRDMGPPAERRSIKDQCGGLAGGCGPRCN